MSKKRKPNRSKSTIQKKLSKIILAFFRENANQSLNYKQISWGLNVKLPEERKLVQSTLSQLVTKNLIVEEGRGKYRLKINIKEVIGRVDMTKRGDAYIVIDELEKDILVKSHQTNRALHNDLVKVMLTPRSGGKFNASIVEVIERDKLEFVGMMDITNKHSFFMPDNPKVHVDFYIPNDALKGAKHGEKVIVSLQEWREGDKSPTGKVKKVLGNPGENEVEMHAILAEFGLPAEFPKGVEETAKNIPIEITNEEVKKRRDFRGITTFTIDPDNAKDFDDALSVQQLENGNWEIGVHIADVGHYVKEGSSIDKEAFKRATSVYLVDRVVPMLPEVLSNNVCSLRPNEEKLTFSAVFEITEQGKVMKEWYGKTVILSIRRFTYDEAQLRIETGEGDLADEIQLLDSIAKKLRKKRAENGSLEISSKEVKFKLDENAKPVGVYTKVMKDANRLIEEFMLLANKKVAKRIGNAKNAKPKTFVYRIHDEPDTEKLKDLKLFVKRFGYQLNIPKGKTIAHALNNLIHEVKGTPEENVISVMLIRSMAKAHYSTQNVGHYGLGFTFYSHFTSPIRRYPDLIAHRLLFKYLNGAKSADENDVEFQCKHSSMRERKAAEAERESIKYKQVEYLLDEVGNIFDGVISGITDWGIYVELEESKCEGMIRLSNLKDDHYYFDDRRKMIVGQRRGLEFNFGDRVKVRIKRADLVNRQIDMELIRD